MAHRVQDSFSHNTFIKSRNIKYKEFLLIVLFVISQIDQFPDTIIAGKESLLELFPLISRSRSL
jgi:hypothetical protein